jgi:hypothetical protein
MAQVQRSVATLRISGDDLDPAQITRLLGCAPTSAQTKGERIVGRDTQVARIASRGMWRLVAVAREPEDLDGQIVELISKMTADIEIWKSIAAKYRVDLFCGIFLRGSNEGLSISPQSLTALGLRQIELALDIYEGDESAGHSDTL